MKDYNQIFNNKVTEAIKGDWFPEQYVAPKFKRDLATAILNVTPAMVQITIEEYKNVIKYIDGKDISAEMPVMFAAIQMLITQTPKALSMTASEWVEAQLGYGTMFEQWQKAVAPHTAAVKLEVEAEAKSDRTKDLLAAGGHKGLAKQIQLGNA